ncbi:hypothetical protein PUNSTDRAFT_51253 [Punctularia strigosozonata HHB-11173 SS5]|uniref:uncharacterized protein n=1 Tax=Punctularia strigosozonata (strain HHB-11173) TaxID=741275 RepID=UPI0004418317|nr:uncharacterized protein PUNSTDRAFT_51253 [Punctularia strigosozonata HHB-11173 SS5]EIN10647.1 hypothetical protein PUNSTDRAFT_51253 [Punctularia strigosozonata HHB-11173 SS5]
MSRLTNPVFNKPSPFDVPRPAHPLSPPDTESEFMAAHHLSHATVPIQMASSGLGLETEPATSHAPVPGSSTNPTETPGARLRRVAYINSGLRDTRDRESRDRSAQRNLRWLVVVLPPATISEAQSHHVGHTLSTGPQHRLSHGILMPLFPTMYGQLTAIAKEFSFPSTTGICLYLHMTEAGITMTPRISEETWSLLWGHLFDARAPQAPAHPLPIGGRIEFDLDLRKARWYEPWLTASRREAADLPISVPPSLSHWRHDSRGSVGLGDDRRSYVEESSPDDVPDAASIIQRTPAQRHVPRKLSLLDRFETASQLSFRAPVPPPLRPSPPYSEQIPPEQRSHTLTPIAQQEEPQSAKRDLESRVNTWRESATVLKTPMAARGQVSLDPANLPNSVSLNDPIIARAAAEEEEVQSELNLDDFTWSISSAGPPSDASISPVAWEYVLSPHLDRRLQGSVCLTPSVCTSFGPEDYDVEYSPVSNAWRLPSPDLGMRMMSDCPPTPTTATSWGPASWPASPAEYSRPPSVHLGDRAVFSRPATPTTATSWGPPSWPASPALSTFSRASSVDLGHRAMFSPVHGHFALPARSLVFPYYNAWKGAVWNHVWPYTAHREVVPKTAPGEPHGDAAYPYLRLYAAAYPHFDLYPPKAGELKVDVSKSLPVSLIARYPAFNLYPAVYPNIELYPVVPRIERVKASRTTGVAVKLAKEYPILDIYPAVYPYNVSDIYAPVAVDESSYYKSQSVVLRAAYPAFNLYPASYPTICIYPSATGLIAANALNVHRIRIASRQASREYPDFDLYPADQRIDDTYYYKSLRVLLDGASMLYPAFDIYPGRDQSSFIHRQTVVGQYPDIVLYPQGQKIDDTFYYKSLSVSLSGAVSHYPHLVIYPSQEVSSPISPNARKAPPTRIIAGGNNVRRPLKSPMPIRRRLSITRAPMPPVPRLPRTAQMMPMSPRLPPPRRERADTLNSTPVSLSTYPHLCIYPAAYPHLEIYPAVAACLEEPLSWTGFDTVYPAFDLYPAVYPQFSIYPAVIVAEDAPSWTGFDVVYPFLRIYPAVYPHLEIYPMASLAGEDVELVAMYPIMCIYPSQYPYFEIYPGEVCDGSVEAYQKSTSVVLAPAYPAFNNYPAQYPAFEIYPGEVSMGELTLCRPLSVRLPAKYPAFQIYAAEYPCFAIYPGSTHAPAVYGRHHRSHRELHDEVVAHFPGLFRRRIHTHAQLHDQVMSEGGMNSITQVESPRSVVSVPISRSRSGSLSSRPAAPSLAAVPARMGPPSPAPSRRLPPIPASPLTPDMKLATAPSTTLPSSRSAGLGRHLSSATRPLPSIRGTMTSMSSLPDSAESSKLESMPAPHPTAESLDRSRSLSSATRPHALMKRNSLVLERARAFNTATNSTSNAPDHPMRITKEALAQFPMPPRPPLPSAPNAGGARPVSVAKLDRSKFPFA